MPFCSSNKICKMRQTNISSLIDKWIAISDSFKVSLFLWLRLINLNGLFSKVEKMIVLRTYSKCSILINVMEQWKKLTESKVVIVKRAPRTPGHDCYNLFVGSIWLNELQVLQRIMERITSCIKPANYIPKSIRQQRNRCCPGWSREQNSFLASSVACRMTF